MSRPIQSAALSSGVTLPYVEQGDPAGVPVVLLHGYSDSWRSWELLLAELPDDVHAFAITQRGHGDADRPADGYQPSDLANDTVAFMDAVGIQAAIVAGHSGGSYTAQRLAIDHPDRTLGLVLIGALHTLQDNAGVKELWDAVSELADPVDPQFVRAFQESTTTRPVPAAFLEAVIAESQKLPARVWKAALRGLLDAAPPTSTGRIAAPSLILWGDDDQLATRGDQDALAAAIEDVRTVVYEHTGHAPHWERPEQVAAELAAFSASIAGTTVEFRRAEATDEPFLEDMLRLAAGWREGAPAALTADIEKYVRGYGRRGDHGIVVLAGGMPVGAAWYRYLAGVTRGYGYVADDIPELSLAVQPHARRRGLGTELVVRLLADAARQRLPGLSLSVEADNPARQLYERLGFERVGDAGTAWTMLRRTTP